MSTIRVQRTDGSWLVLDCIPSEQTGCSASLYIPAWDGTWFICSGGMIGNVGGNDWRIYTLNPDDCAALVKGPTEAETSMNVRNDAPQPNIK